MSGEETNMGTGATGQLQARNEAARLRLLTEAVGALNSALSYTEMLAVIMNLVPEQLDCERATLYLIQGSEESIKSEVTLGETGLTIRLKKGQGLAGWVAETGQSLRVEDAYDDARFNRSYDLQTGFRTRAVMCVPARLRGDEIVAVLQAINKDGGFTLEDQAYLETFAAHVALALERDRTTRELIARRVLDSEIETARELQQRFLPSGPFLDKGIEIAGIMKPCHTVGGDLFDWGTLKNGQIGFTTGDVSGKGVGASLMMCAVQTSLRALARQQYNPRILVEELNRLLVADNPVSSFVTFFLGIIDSDTLVMRYVNAGHTMPVLYRPGADPVWLDQGGMVLGIWADPQYDEGTVQLAKGDTIVLYTDGVSESANEAGVEYGSRPIVDLLNQTTGNSAEICQKIIESAETFNFGPARDDITCVCVRILP
jgi:sigma-B regulation protein RsbU (phosphoserine phosphatase)